MFHWPVDHYITTSFFSVGLVAFLTFPCLKKFDNVQLTSDTCSSYQDDDGVATEESETRAASSRTWVTSSLKAVPAVGFAAALLATGDTDPSLKWISRLDLPDIVIWALLYIHAAAVASEKVVHQRYKLAVNGALSATVLLARLGHNWARLQAVGYGVPWLQLTVILVLLFIFLSYPRRPVVFRDNLRVDNEDGASVLDRLSFSWGYLHQETVNLPSKLRLADLPGVGYKQRVRTVRRCFDNGDEKMSLWIRLVQAVLKPLVQQWILVLLKALCEFGSRFALHRLLQSLERDAAADNRTWIWVVSLGIGLLGETLAGNWMTWVTNAKLQMPVAALLQSLAFEKMTRKQSVNISTENKKQGTSSIDEMISNDTSIIAQATSDSAQFPMAVFKLLLDVVYLTRLLGIKSIVIGSIFPLLAVPLSNRLSSKHQQLHAQQSKAHSNLSNLISEALQGLHQIRLSSLERFWRGRLLGARTDELRRMWAARVQLELLNLAANLGPILFTSVAISVYALDTGHLTPSTAFAALSLFGNLHGVFRQLPHMAASLQKSWASCKKLERYFQDLEQSLSSHPSDSISFEHAVLTWPGEQSNNLSSASASAFQLNDVNLQFPRGNLTVIAGKVGSGKSLLLASILDEGILQSGRFEKPDVASSSEKGHIVLGSTAFVSQPPWIQDCTVQENIIFGYDFNQERYEKVLNACALEQDFATLANGDGTRAGAGGTVLSGGQKWRVALARALYSPAEILVLEDVLGAVDTPVARWICDNALTGEMAEGRTLILATHHPEICHGAASYVVTMKDGSASGKSKEVENCVPNTTINAPKKSPSVAEPGTKEPNNSTPEKPNPPQSVPRSYAQILMAYLFASGSVKAYLVGALVTISYRVFSAGHSWWLARWSTEPEDQQHSQTAHNIGVYMLLSAGSAVALGLQSLVFTWIGLAASKSLFERMVRNVLAAKLHWIDTTPFGQVVQSLDHDMYMIDDRTAPQLNGILGTAIHLMFIGVTSSLSAPYTIISSIIVLVLYLNIASRVFALSAKLRPLLGPSMFPVSSHTNSTALGLTTIRAFGRTSLYIEQMQDLIDIATKVGMHLALGLRWSHSRQGMVGAAFVVITAAAMVHSNVDAATTGFTITLALELRAALLSMVSQVGAVRMGFNAIDRVLTLTDTPTETEQGNDAPESWPANGQIEVQNLTVQYSPNLPRALNNVSFTVRPRQRVGVVGRTGAGKSSLTNALLRFVDATEGKICIDGLDIKKLRLQRLRSAVTLIPQDPFLFSGSLRCNIDPYGDRSDSELLSALRRVLPSPDATKQGTDFSDLDLAISSGGSNLSHGQRQLVCLARAMLGQCRILILDEATSGIDGATDAAIQQVIREEFTEWTVVVVAHKLLSIADFDSVLVLSRGEVVEFDTPQVLLETKGSMFGDMVNHSGDEDNIRRVIGGSNVG